MAALVVILAGCGNASDGYVARMFGAPVTIATDDGKVDATIKSSSVAQRIYYSNGSVVLDNTAQGAYRKNVYGGGVTFRFYGWLGNGGTVRLTLSSENMAIQYLNGFAAYVVTGSGETELKRNTVSLGTARVFEADIPPSAWAEIYTVGYAFVRNGMGTGSPSFSVTIIPSP